MNSSNQYHIPLTIERHLKGYSECENHTDRHEILWHEWNHNKRWLIQLQQLILPSFPSYSKHDVTHSEAVLHNIEMVLGEENIKDLSATDCFLLLHTVYIHDIGMCITDEDRRVILKNKKFQDFLQTCAEGMNVEMRKYASLLLQACFKGDDSDYDIDYILEQKLEVYYAIIYLISDFRRQEHGRVSQDRLVSWIDQPDKLGVGFSAIEIPRRLFHIVANCASTHTNWDFEAVMDLSQEDMGFAHDYVHPRFIAVLLQLGDALDMDNDRFHPLIKEYLGHMPSASQVHYGKHKSIRKLKITNKEISIEADCNEPDELRLIRMECDGIQHVLRNASCHWATIRPNSSNMALPAFEKTRLLLQGKPIPADLVTARFSISQEKAFQLIKGNSIYKNEGFVFLRELLQNAIDATKMQYFRDGVRACRRRGTGSLDSPNNAREVLSPMDYPVEIDLYMKKVKNNIFEEITEEDIIEPKERLKGYECGVLVKIRDYATGISSTDISLIADVGTSYKTRKREIDHMPKWLRPTGNFGVGLQSAFLAGKELVATTYTRKGEQYKIIFYPRDRGFEGYINAIPLDNEQEPKPFGTCFEIFVPINKRKLHVDSPKTWDGKDPFGDEYVSARPLRHSVELMEQMALYLQKLVGELLFPVTLRIHDCRIKSKDDYKKYYQVPFLSEIDGTGMGVEIGNHDFSASTTITRLNNPWNCGLAGDYGELYRSDNGDVYRLDCDQAKLYVWNGKYNIFACFGIKGILELRDQTNHSKKLEVIMKTKVYYKGMLVTKVVFRDDANLLEYLDLKDMPGKEPLKLNRDGFSQKGYDYLNEVYSEIVKTARDALKYFATNCNEYKDSLMYKMESKITRLLEEKRIAEANKSIIGCAALTYFTMVDEGDEVFGGTKDCKTTFWNTLITNISSMLSQDNYSEARELLIKTSTLYQIPVLENEGDLYRTKEKRISILEIVNNENKYAILSKRGQVNRGWNSYLIAIPEKQEIIKNMVKGLRNASNFDEREEKILELEKIGNELVSRKLDSDIGNSVEWRFKEQVLFKWMLSNIPTLALFSSHDGDTRINVLDTEICDSVFLGNSMKNLIINRMLDTYEKEGLQRFSSMVWSGYSYLGLYNPHISVKFIKRGKLARTAYGEMIIPLTGEQMTDVRDEVRKRLGEAERDIKRLYIDVYEKILPYISERESLIPKLRNRYLDFIMTTKPDNEDSRDELDRLLELSAEDYSVLVDSLAEERSAEDANIFEISRKRELSDDVKNEKITPRIRILKRKYADYLKCSINIDVRLKFCKGVDYQNLLFYTEKYAKLRPSALQVETLYLSHIHEMVMAMVEWEKEEFKENLNWELRSVLV